MSQIFCVRTEVNIGLAVLLRYGDSVVLCDTYSSSSAGIGEFPSFLRSLIRKHAVKKIFVSPLLEGEPVPRSLFEFRNVPEHVEITQMRYIIRPISGRMARAQLLRAGQLDEASDYEQSAKLQARIERIDDQNIPPDIHAYLIGLVLVEDVSHADETLVFGFGMPSHETHPSYFY